MELASTVGLWLATMIVAAPADSRELDQLDLPRRVQALVARIHENHDRPDSEVAPAGDELIVLGLPALHHGALELITSDDPDTRRHGERVLYEIVLRQFGFAGGRWNFGAHALCDEFWKELGAYRHDMPEPDRRNCYENWKAWVATVDELTPKSNPNRLRPPRVDPPTTTDR